MIKQITCLIVFLLVTLTVNAQGFKVRECTEGEIPRSSREKYYQEAQRTLENYYYLLLESMGNTDNRDYIIDQTMSKKNGRTFKPEFTLNLDDDVSFCSPLQYFTRFESEYHSMGDEVDFMVDNFKCGKIMMNSLVSCFIPIEYDLTVKHGERVLFKRRCRIHCLFPKVSVDKWVQVMQIEPVKDIIAYREKVQKKEVDAWFKKGLEFYNKGEYKQAVGWFTKAAEQGDVRAQCNLGVCFELGRGVPKSEAKAVEWYTKSAEQGDATAQYNLGLCYAYGRGVPKSEVKAVEWYTKSAEQGHARAQCNLGYCYENGHGVDKDLEKAFYWYEKSAKQDYIRAQYILGGMYNIGKGVTKNYNEAFFWYKKAAENKLGKNKSKDEIEKQANAEIQVSFMLVFGRGCQRSIGEGLTYSFDAVISWILIFLFISMGIGLCISGIMDFISKDWFSIEVGVLLMLLPMGIVWYVLNC